MRMTFESSRLLQEISAIAERIQKLTPDPVHPEWKLRAYLVGGCVRDALLGIPSKDADLEVYGVTPERLEQIIEEMYPGRVNRVGQSFCVLKVFLGEGREIDVSIPRRDSKIDKGHKGFVIEGDPEMTIDEAVCRRDFTINALISDPLTGEVIDRVGGLKDLEERRLRVVDSARFQDDPLRVYRALQLVGRFGLTVEDQAFALMKEMVEQGDLEELSKERITEELKKLLLKSERPSLGLELARSLGIIERYMPEVQALIGVEQEHEWHPEGDVWTHTMMVVDEAASLARKESAFSQEERLQLMVGALCHDFGKPATTKILDGRLRSLGHEEAGVEPTKHFCSRLSFGYDVSQAAMIIAAEHLKPRVLWNDLQKGRLNQAQYVNAVRRLLKRIQPLSWRVFLAATEADLRGRGFPEAATTPYEAGDFFAKTIIKNSLEETLKPLISGTDLVTLGISPGERMGELIRMVEEARDEGEVKTKEEAMEWVKRRL